MKIIIVGAQGTIGQHVKELLHSEGHEIISVGKTRGDFQVDVESRESVAELFSRIGDFDALAVAAGDVAFAPLAEINSFQWKLSLGSKLMGQINLVQEAIPHLRVKGSITLVSGIIGEENIAAGVVAATVNSALESFVKAAALELPRGIRINIVSPTWLSDSAYGSFFPGFAPVEGVVVAQAYKKSIAGILNGTVIKAR